MPVLAVSAHDRGHCLDLVLSMFRLRYQVFKGRLNWDVSTSGDMEIDAFDALEPDYLIGLDEEDRIVDCARLLPSCGPTMLANTFPALLGDRRAPNTPLIYESSRFCVDTSSAHLVAKGGLRQATYIMLAGVLEWGLRRNLDAIVTVTDTRFERILQRTGWPLARFAAPQQIGDTMAVAGILELTAEALQAVRAAGHLDHDVLIFPADRRQAA